MYLQVYHRTEYRYSEPVTNNVNELRLTPPNTLNQHRDSHFISVLPASRLSHYEDLNVNMVHHFEVHQPHERLVIESRATVRTSPKVDFEHLPYGFQHKDLPQCRAVEECHPYLQGSHYIEITPQAWRQALDIQDMSEDVFQTSYAIMEHIFRNYTYQSGTTNVSTHANEVLYHQTGVCQDFAHAMVAMCRSIKIPARYVSGYFFDATRDHSLRGSEASHAWVEVYVPPFGWIGLDPTNNKVVDETYITLAHGRDYRDVAPVIGSYYGSARSGLSIHVEVSRLNHKTKAK